MYTNVNRYTYIQLKQIEYTTANCLTLYDRILVTIN